MSSSYSPSQLLFNKSKILFLTTLEAFHSSSKAPEALPDPAGSVRVVRLPFMSYRCDYSHSVLIIGHLNPRGPKKKKIGLGYRVAFKWTDDQIKSGVSGLEFHSGSWHWHFRSREQHVIPFENCKPYHQSHLPNTFSQRFFRNHINFSEATRKGFS